MKDFYAVQKDKPGFGVVYPLPLDDAVEIHKNIQADTKLRNKLANLSYYKILDKSYTDGGLTEKERGIYDWWGGDYLNTAYDKHYDKNYFYRSHLVVELNATDEIILKSFKSWLSANRDIEKEISSENNDHPKKLTDNLRKRWISAEILPYIDLEIYQKLEGVKFPLHLIGGAIFSDDVDFDTTEAVRKTTRTLAYNALKQSDAILRHALIIAEQNKTA